MNAAKLVVSIALPPEVARPVLGFKNEAALAYQISTKLAIHGWVIDNLTHFPTQLWGPMSSGFSELGDRTVPRMGSRPI